MWTTTWMTLLDVAPYVFPSVSKHSTCCKIHFHVRVPPTTHMLGPYNLSDISQHCNQYHSQSTPSSPRQFDWLKTLLAEWGDQEVCSQRELESLVTILSNACKVGRPRRSFLRHKFNRLKGSHVRHTGQQPTRHINLNRDFHYNMIW